MARNWFNKVYFFRKLNLISLKRSEHNLMSINWIIAPIEYRNKYPDFNIIAENNHSFFGVELNDVNSVVLTRIADKLIYYERMFKQKFLTYIKKNNKASTKSFERAKFVYLKDSSVNNIECIELIWKKC